MYFFKILSITSSLNINLLLVSHRKISPKGPHQIRICLCSMVDCKQDNRFLPSQNIHSCRERWSLVPQPPKLVCTRDLLYQYSVAKVVWYIQLFRLYLKGLMSSTITWNVALRLPCTEKDEDERWKEREAPLSQHTAILPAGCGHKRAPRQDKRNHPANPKNQEKWIAFWSH